MVTKVGSAVQAGSVTPEGFAPGPGRTTLNWMWTKSSGRTMHKELMQNSSPTNNIHSTVPNRDYNTFNY